MKTFDDKVTVLLSYLLYFVSLIICNMCLRTNVMKFVITKWKRLLYREHANASSLSFTFMTPEYCKKFYSETERKKVSFYYLLKVSLQSYRYIDGNRNLCIKVLLLLYTWFTSKLSITFSLKTFESIASELHRILY